MGKRFDMMLYPGGKKKALTLSYDDGVCQDRRLIEILDRYGLKCTFNLGSGVLGYQDQLGGRVSISKVMPEEVASLYANHEVAGHGLWHSSLVDIGTPAAMYEICEDRRRLEELTGKLIRGFAYPFGLENDDVREILRLAGIESARTVVSTHSFSLPKDFLKWDPTCHHNDPELMSMAKEFCESDRMFASGELFYLWGHAYEFDVDQNWDRIEEFAKYVSGYRDTVWFATNTEIVEYVKAFRGLRYSSDARLVYNPSATTVLVQVMRDVVEIPAGATVVMPETPL